MKIASLLSAIILVPVMAFSQDIEPLINVSPFKFGFNIAPNVSFTRPGVKLPNDITQFSTLNYRLGIKGNYSFNRSVSISPEINWSFNEGGFRFSDTTQVDYILFPMSFDIMTHVILKKKSEKISPYCLIGPNLKLPFFKKSAAMPYKTNKDIAINLGIGIEKRFTYFTFSPEIRYSYGLTNVSTHPLIPSARYDNISLALNVSM